MGNSSIRGATREKMVAQIKNDLAFSEYIPRKDRLFAIHAYLQKHPDYTIRMVCAAAGVCLATYQKFVKAGATGFNVYLHHRKILAEAIDAMIREDPEMPIGIYEATRRLREQGHTCSPWLISDIMQENGYVPTAYSINGIEKFLEYLTENNLNFN